MRMERYIGGRVFFICQYATSIINNNIKFICAENEIATFCLYQNVLTLDILTEINLEMLYFCNQIV